MRSANLFRIAYQSIIKHKMRTLLTMLGIIIGVGAVIVMVAIGQGAQATIQGQISSLGTNLVLVFPGVFRQAGVSMGGGSFTRLSFDDVEKLKRESTKLTGISPVVRTGAQVIGGISNWSTSVYGVSTDYLSIREWPLSAGEFFTEGDVRSQTKVCVLGQTLVKNLFPDDDPVGQQVRIRNVPFKVIGVLSEKGQNSMGMDQDDIVLAPSSTVFYRLSGFRFISQILTSASSTAEIPAAQEEIRTILRESHKINEGEDDDFTVRNQTELASTAEETTKVMTILLASIASISLLVGGIGIMNIMLVSVTERTREIGVRMALGARSRDILVQFLVEAVVISIVGGLIGIVLGVGATLVVGAVTSWSTVIVPSTLFVSVGFSAMVGIFFGLYPAKKASDLNPIEALRYE